MRELKVGTVRPTNTSIKRNKKKGEGKGCVGRLGNHMQMKEEKCDVVTTVVSCPLSVNGMFHNPPVLWVGLVSGDIGNTPKDGLGSVTCLQTRGMQTASRVCKCLRLKKQDKNFTTDKLWLCFSVNLPQHLQLLLQAHLILVLAPGTSAR